MKKKTKVSFLPYFALLFGTIAMMLRRRLYLTAVDAKGLLLRNTSLEIMLLALTAAVFGIVFLALRNDRGNGCYEDNYAASIPAALGHVAAAAGMFLVRGMSTGAAGFLGLFWQILGVAAPVCLVLAGIARSLGKKPFFLFHVIPCLFLLVYTINSYRFWSSNPQMQDYLFSLLAVLALALFAHHTAAFEAGIGNRKMVLGAGLAAVYLCLAELAWTHHPALYFGGMLWALTGMCRVIPKPEKEKD